MNNSRENVVESTEEPSQVVLDHDADGRVLGEFSISILETTDADGSVHVMEEEHLRVR